jgi:hypothetical protein
LEHYDNTPLAEDLHRIFDKIVHSMPDRVTVGTSEFDLQVSIISEHQRQIDANVFERIFASLRTRQADSSPFKETKLLILRLKH